MPSAPGCGLTFATRRPEGFSDADFALLRAIEAAMAMVLELNRVWILLRETLRMYVGEEPQARILSGQVRRGDVVHIVRRSSSPTCAASRRFPAR